VVACAVTACRLAFSTAARVVVVAAAVVVLTDCAVLQGAMARVMTATREEVMRIFMGK
jgi:hypothetical protein